MHKVSNTLECRLHYCANRNVFNWRLKLSTESSGSRRYSGKLFQVQQQQKNEVHKWTTWQVEQLVDCSEMTGVDVWMMVSVLLGNAVQRDILEPRHGDNDKL